MFAKQVRRWFIGSLLVCGCINASIEAGEFPYTATVAHNNVTARSGPTMNAYPTEKLPRGSQVEVYQTGANGWLAIRPTAEAFDWLPAPAVERTQERDVAKVIDEFPVFVGSNVTKAEKHLSQVTLKKGETVQILAEKTVAAEKGGQETWYKIAPPAGEFRWVQAKFLTRQSAAEFAAAEEERLQAREEMYREQNQEHPPGVLGRLKRERDANRTNDLAQTDVVERIKQKMEERRPRDPEPQRNIDPVLARRSAAMREREEVASLAGKEVEKTASISLDPRGYQRDSNATEKANSAEFSAEFKAIRAKDFERSLAEIELDLTQMVAQDQSLWRIGGLHTRAEELVAQGSTPLERGRARLLLEKITQFEATLPPGFEEPTTPPTKLPGMPNNYAVASGKEPSPDQYDGLGYLVAAKIVPAGVPKYQIVDDKGNLLQYVSPAPGVNLDSYVGKRVGVKGPRGYSTSLKQQHVVAERVIDMNRQFR